MRALEDTIARHHRAGKHGAPVAGIPVLGGAPGPVGATGARPRDFERRVAEADAYLQIMIEQIKVRE